MKWKHALFFCFLLIIVISSLIAKHSDNCTYIQSRCHKALFLDDGSDEGMTSEFTDIFYFQPQKTNIDTQIAISNIVLLQLQKTGKWIYKCIYPTYKNDGKIIWAEPCLWKEEIFEFLPSAEKLSVKYQFSSDGKNIEKYILTSLQRQKSKELTFKDVKKADGSYDNFLAENFSSSFVNELEQLRRFIFLAYQNKIDFVIYPSSFRALYGYSPETDGAMPLKEYADKETIGQIHFPIALYPNCDFDAKFGYPCSPEEVPSINPKILVIEKKQ